MWLLRYNNHTPKAEQTRPPALTYSLLKFSNKAESFRLPTSKSALFIDARMLALSV